MILDEPGEILRPATALLSLPIAMVLISAHMAVQAVVDVFYLKEGRLPPELAESAPNA